jgi:hypothetical protein
MKPSVIQGFRRAAFLMAAFLPAYAWAAGGDAAPIVIVSDTRRLKGLFLWWANLYNESHLLFTLMTIILVPVMGATLGFLMDFIMKKIGIDLSSRELKE